MSSRWNRVVLLVAVAGLAAAGYGSGTGHAAAEAAVAPLGGSGTIAVGLHHTLPASPGRVGGTDCGPHERMTTNHIIVQAATINCTEARALIDDYLNDPRTLRGDRGAMMRGWSCNILGAVEAEEKGYVVGCTSAADKVTLGPPR